MRPIISRRGFLGSALAAGVSPALAHAAPASPTPPQGGMRLTAGTRVLEVNGKPAPVFSLLGPQGTAGLRLGPGERFRVELVNRTGVRTLVHWHGQLPPWMQDGFPWPQTPPIANGAVHDYDFRPIAGTYWMHSHHGLQEQQLLTAPLIVHDAAELREDRQEVVLMLHDFTFRSPDEVLAGLMGTTMATAKTMVRQGEQGDSRHAPPGGAAPAGATTAMGGMTGMTTPAGATAAMGGMPGMATPAGATAMSSMSGTAMPAGATAPMGGMPGMATPGPVPPMRMDLNDVRYDAFLANDRTLADPQHVPVAPGGRVRLRIINGASSSQFWIDLGALVGHVVATDGHPVHPVAGSRFPLAIAQRLDILVDLPRAGAFPVLARLEGTRRQTGIVLATPGAPIRRIADAGAAVPPIDTSLETRLAAVTPLAPRPADLVRTIALGGSMKPYAWSMNGEYWPHSTPLMLRQGQRVEIELVNRSMMAHPIHLHGHVFQVIAIDGQPIRGAIRDTVLVPPMNGRVRFAFDADNPGRWAFHCHNLYHMMTGMMMEFRYDGIPA